MLGMKAAIDKDLKDISAAQKLQADRSRIINFVKNQKEDLPVEFTPLTESDIDWAMSLSKENSINYDAAYNHSSLWRHYFAVKMGADINCDNGLRLEKMSHSLGALQLFEHLGGDIKKYATRYFVNALAANNTSILDYLKPFIDIERVIERIDDSLAPNLEDYLKTPLEVWKKHCDERIVKKSYIFDSPRVKIREDFNFESQKITLFTQIGDNHLTPVIQHFHEHGTISTIQKAYDELVKQGGRPSPLTNQHGQPLKKKSLPLNT